MEMDFDIVIVGAGSAGCVLANRLSKDSSCRVALVEAGAEPDPRLADVPGAASWMQNTRSDWAFTTTPQSELYGRRIPYPRGRVLGGTSVLNYMVYVRGNRGDFDSWAQMGNLGWSYSDVLPYFCRSESNAIYDDPHHGKNGPLSVETNSHRQLVNDYVVRAAQERGVPFNPDINGAEQEGTGYYQATQKDGLRCSTVRAFLDPARDRPNLAIFKNALVHAVVVEKERAIAVDALVDGKIPMRLRASTEVVLSAGSIGSPHIMMLSGLGPAEHLRDQSIDVIADLPDVGANLQDHLGPDAMRRRLADPKAVYGEVAGSFEEALAEFEATGGGPMATHHIDSGAFFSIDPSAKFPQCQAFFTTGLAEFYRDNGKLDTDHICIGGYLCRPRSRGTVRLSSSNPLDPPLIDPNYLSDPDDLRLMSEQIRWSIDVLKSPVLDEICTDEFRHDLDTDAEIEHWIRSTSGTIWHPTSTCRMGPGEGSVVDPELRVHGIEGLSICDASIMPSMVSGNTNAPTIMIAEKGSDLIKARAK